MDVILFSFRYICHLHTYTHGIVQLSFSSFYFSHSLIPSPFLSFSNFLSSLSAFRFTRTDVLTCVHATQSQAPFLPSSFFIAPSIINSSNIHTRSCASVISPVRAQQADKNTPARERCRDTLFIIKFLYGFTSPSTTCWCNRRLTHTSRSPLTDARLRYIPLPSFARRLSFTE